MAAVCAARPGHTVFGAAIAVSLLWSTASILADLVARRRARRGERDLPTVAPAVSASSVTTLVRLGDEPAEVARTSLLMALDLGPTQLVTDEQRPLPPGLDPAIVPHRAPTVEAAISAAAQEVDTDAILVVSARAVPAADACRAAVARLGGTTDWTSGRSEPFSQAGFAPDSREVLSARLRSRARGAGLELWEPDATLIRSEALRDHPLQPGQTWGSWLRSRREEGRRGASVDATLAYRTTPLDPDAYWPDAIARQRAEAADLAAAARTGLPTARLLAALLLARELHAVSLSSWIALVVWVGATGELPFDVALLPATVAVAAVAALRWVSLRGSLGFTTRVTDDVVSCLHHLPGSLASVPSALRGDIRPLRSSIPTRPLVWASLALTVVAGGTLLDHDVGAPVSKTAVGTSLAVVGLLWAFMMHALVQRTWRRGTHRVPLQLPVSVEGRPLRSVDVSPGGLAVVGSLDGSPTAVGDTVDLDVELDDGSVLRTGAVVAGRRTSHGEDLLGLSLCLDGEGRRRWLTQVLRAAGAAPPNRTHPRRGVPTEAEPSTPARIGRVYDLALRCAAGVLSAGLVALLVLVLLGFRPLVIRSASMVPTLAIGDVVLAEQVVASELERGDIVTQPQRGGPEESITHRVVTIDTTGELLTIETRGDANEAGERWTVGPDELVGRTRWALPWIGTLATSVRTSSVQLAGGLAVLVLVVASMVRPRRSLSRPPLDDVASRR